jgi:hypothetical protein
VRIARTAGRDKALVCRASKNSKTTTSVEVAPTPLQVRSRFVRSPDPTCVCETTRDPFPTYPTQSAVAAAVRGHAHNQAQEQCVVIALA